MTDEFDPTVELGLPPDRYFVCSCWGFLTRNNDIRNLCGDFIGKGEHFFDVLERYDKLTSYVLSREDATAGSYYKWSVPFLKAHGATDHLIHEYSKKNLKMMANSSRTMKYISSLLPAYITTAMYEHGMMEVMERLNAPLCQVADTKLCIDQSMMGRAEARNIKDLAAEINKLKVPKSFYELNVPTELKDEDIEIIKLLDSVFPDKISSLGAMGLMESTDPMTSHRKAYRMLDIRRLTSIDLDSTMYVGSAATDFQPLDLVRDAQGLALSFNGEEFTVRGCNVAVMSEDTTVAALFASAFADKGSQMAMTIAENWSRDYLKKMDFSDQALLDTFLRENPDKLPEVHCITEKNVEKISKRSDAYRKKVLG
jgi:predicted HAD superfamily phosphohydrolase